MGPSWLPVLRPCQTLPPCPTHQSLTATHPALCAQRGPSNCAIYTRKSTEEGLEQDFNALDAQRDAAQSFIASQRAEGWTLSPTHYNDGGYTGANMDRPALQQLLTDIRAGRTHCVVVYKVDRLTRSLLDFSRIIDEDVLYCS